MASIIIYHKGKPMPERILTEFIKEIKEQILILEIILKEKLDFSLLERDLIKLCNKLVADILKEILNKLFGEKEFLNKLKTASGSLKYKEHREVNVSLSNGETIKVSTPYFLLGGRKRKAKKRGPNSRGSYFGLEVLGILEHCSPDYLSDIVQMALLCPSLEVAKTVLSRRGINIDVKRLRRLCKNLGQMGLNNRGEISLSESEKLTGKTLVIGIDGGRIRERIRKKERKPEQKRDGYHSDWKEPKLFTIYLLDEKGKIVKEFAPLHDATMENYETMFVFLEQYLTALNIDDVEKIVFCGDGSPTIWKDVEKLLIEMNIDTKKIFQVLDYTHAKQNLRQIIDFAPIKQRNNLEIVCKEMLWNGDIDGILNVVNKVIKNKAKRGQAIKKWENYFKNNEKRMQYTKFRESFVPCGSGCVESAIRRVINLRLKAPGIFWTKEMAECFLFLRSQLISGRWDIFMKNIIQLKRKFMPSECQPGIPVTNKEIGQIFKNDNYYPNETLTNAA